MNLKKKSFFIFLSLQFCALLLWDYYLINIYYSIGLQTKPWPPELKSKEKE